MTTASSSRYHSRFIPSEEIGEVSAWRFGAVGASAVSALEDPQAPPDAPIFDEEAMEAERATREAALRQAREEGFAQGLEQGRCETALEWQRRMDGYIADEGQEKARRLGELVQAVDAGLAALEQRMAQQVLQLACAIARQVVRQEITINPNVVEPVVREAMGTLVADGRPAVIRLHPQDLDAVQQPLQDEFAGASSVRWVGDAALSPGGCVVESAGMVIDGTVEKRWVRAVAALGIDVPWTGEPGDAA
ncbi:flagellar assembly protein FliH [Ramlibacter sp. H39-3-26]|uniref:FliH/SctL family protein n=1 Tax=Curvibacter soli TaxID=3031331 RepID=UPI0023D99511|nr:flagellar assembly protein FliH [Ramlibacter sp. H39-3-26]MDF1485771.1 flagellar assembly protein FliH [Ramlibacter sp. H39-3-26]